MQRLFLDQLVCPACHGDLAWQVTAQQGERVDTAEARCAGCAAPYSVREGIGLLLTPDLPRDDLWAQAESGLARHLRAHPDIDHRLMDVPVATLAPADQFFRALVLEERGQYAAAQALVERARTGLYTAEYRACAAAAQRALLQHLAATPAPLGDLASGRGELVATLARRGDRPILAIDFSPTVLRRTRRRLETAGLAGPISFLACDARRLPFRTGAMATLTTNLGLANMAQPEQVLREVRRTVGGTFLAIAYFFPEADRPNQAAVQAAPGGALLYRRTALEHLAAAGWQVAPVRVGTSVAQPTPRSVLLEGATIDGLPVAGTVLEWWVLVAR
jgi:uncharacterized protein YbaR (Trm112 family)